MATPRPRQRNPRIILLRDLRNFKRYLTATINRWNVGATVYIDSANRKPGENAWRRARHAHEYPENQPGQWLALAKSAKSAAIFWQSVAEHATKQAEYITSRDTANKSG